MHEIVPRFLLDRVAEGQERGAVDATALYLDLAGFTPMSEALSRHGTHGAEVVAEIIDEIWNPIVAAVHARGGFIAASAGDAVLALFTDDAHRARGRAAAIVIADSVARPRQHDTPYGPFTIAAKLGLGSGSAAWEALRSHERRRAAYLFQGSAIARAVAAESEAEPGRLIIDPSVDAQADDPPDRAPEPPPPRAARPQEPHPLAATFAPPEVLEWDGPGEFRSIVPVFVSFPGERLHAIVEDAFELQDRFGGLLRPVEVGDKGHTLMLVWGVPVGFERDAERAVRFADELRRRHPQVRIGASSGVAFTGIIGSAVRAEFAIFGAHVNLAARLMACACAGQVMISPVAGRPGARSLLDRRGGYPAAEGDRQARRAAPRARHRWGGDDCSLARRAGARTRCARRCARTGRRGPRCRHGRDQRGAGHR